MSRMANHDGLCDTDLFDCFLNEVRLRVGGPEFSTRTIAIAKAWPVEGDDPIVLFCFVNDAADLPIGDGSAIPMQQNDRGSSAARIEIVQANAVDRDELANGRIFFFSP